MMASLPAAEVRVDQVHDWWEPSVSHHDKHFEGGLAIGAATYGLASLATDSRPWRYADAALTGAVIGIGFEVVEGRGGASYMDPVDAGWVVAGSIVGAGVADLTSRVVTIGLCRGGGSATVALRF